MSAGQHSVSDLGEVCRRVQLLAALVSETPQAEFSRRQQPQWRKIMAERGEVARDLCDVAQALLGLFETGDPDQQSSDQKPTPPAGLLRFWRLFFYILPRTTRERVFEPAFNDLQVDYLETKGKYRTRWAKRWLVFCFTLRTVLMVDGCLRAWAQDATVSWLLSFVPDRVRRWIRML